MVYKGYELLKAIANGEIKEGSRFVDSYGEYIYEDDRSGEKILYRKDEITGKYETPDYRYFADNCNDFELIQNKNIED